MSPGTNTTLVSVTWRDANSNAIPVSAYIQGVSAQSVLLGDAIAPPANTDLSKQPETIPADSAYWHAPSQKLYASAPASFVARWRNSARAPLDVPVTVSWPGSSSGKYQVHVAGSPAAGLANWGGGTTAQLLSLEGVGAAVLGGAVPQFTNSAAGKSLVLLSPGNPQQTNIYFQFIQTVTWDDGAYLVDHVPAAIGQEITPQAGWHATNFGGPFLFNLLSRYCPSTVATNYHNRATRLGPIIPVNRDQTSTTADDMVVVYYQAGTKLWDPVSSSLLATPNIGWPYKPVRYDCQWPASPESITIASQSGSGAVNLNNWSIYVQNDPTKPGYNPNDEHAFVYPGQGRPAQLRVNPGAVTVTEGGVVSVEVALVSSQAPVEEVRVTVSGAREGGTNLVASFSSSPTDVVTETVFTPLNWSTPQTIYIRALSDTNNVDATNLFTVRASGGLFDQKAVAVREADTNGLQLVAEAQALTVPEGTARSFGVRLTQPPPGSVTVNIARTSGDSDLTVQPAQLTFSSGNWDTAQPVAVSAAADADSLDGVATFSLTASGGLSTMLTVAVTEADDDPAPLAVYALRDDLGDRPGTSTPIYSEPYVLLTYTDAQSRPAVKVYQVVVGSLTYAGTAGREIQPPYPLGVKFLGWEMNSYGVSGPYWRDRKQFFWARAAGDDGGMASVVMKYFYPVTDATFFFPEGSRYQQMVPWLDRRANPGVPTGIPTDVTYQIRWPDSVPELRFGESLVKAKLGLPGIKGQKSLDVIYEQTAARGLGPQSSVKVIDAEFTHETPLAALPSDTQGKTVTTLVQAGKAAPGSVFFTPLPPHLRSRFWYDPNDHRLKFTGQFVDEYGTAEPVGYVLLNVLTTNDLAELRKLSPSANSDSVAFQNALMDLAGSSKAGQPRPVASNTVQQASTITSDTFALTAGLAVGTGYVTVAFNNVVSPPVGLPANRGTPVSLEIIRVTCPLYQGETKVIYPPDPFDEKVSLRHSGDFAGQADGYWFEWQHHPGPGKPATNSTIWTNNTFISQFGAADTVIVSAGARTLSDWWYRCRWRTTNTANPCGTNWSAWTEPALTEGWIKRVLRNINFYSQFDTNLIQSTVDVVANTISKAGARWIGAAPLNVDGISQLGLIEIYETVLKRGIELSIENPSYASDPGVDRALLLMAAQLANIYSLLGNEAYADAADPTIGFVTTGVGAGQFGVEASSVHCFMDQAGIDSLLAEELALLRGLDDSFGRDVRSHPIYNRLPPNIGPGFQAEPAYVLNYDIKDADNSGTINAADALKIWPQGHGDAWGHYLMAIKNFYRLLRNDHFTWVVTNEFVTLAGSSTAVPVNYQHERKFAEVAAAKARTGAEIVNLTYRSKYVENPDGQWQGYLDANTNRAWGLSEWASRTGQGTYLDWVTGNALLPPDSAEEGIAKVDRTTVTELREVASGFVSIQDELDKADAGLNPLGLAKNVIPFDIDPAKVDAGQTHFEQIYERATKAMNNAIGVFNHANASTQKLREQADTVEDFQRTVAERENDFTNRLIEVFGYPYPNDPAYAGNPNVPDLFHYMYSDYSDITGEVPPQPVTFTARIADFVVATDGSLSRVTNIVSYQAGPNGFGLVKPSNWTTPRRAPGEIQMAHSELLQATARFKRALAEYDNLLNQIEDQAALLQAQYNLNADEITVLSGGQAVQESLNDAIRRSRDRQLTFQKRARLASLAANAISEAFPKVFGIIAGLANGFTIDASGGLRSAVLLAGNVVTEIMTQNANQESLVELDHQQAKESASALQNISLTTIRQEQSILQQVAQLEQIVRQEALLRLELYSQQEAMQQASGRYASTLAKGQRLLEERLRFRQQTAARVQGYRYKDMAFRIFRNEALQQYRAQFDLAARYVYLAAAAYDYETNLRDTETRWRPGSSILTDIVRARSLGVISGETPQPGPGPGHRGDGGLAAALWAMHYSWSDAQQSLKTQLGFNNPSREHLTFSLRAGLFRAFTNDYGDASWRAWLTASINQDVGAIPDFVRYCKPPNGFGTGGFKEPGIVIPFPSAIVYRHNFFGWPEIGGGGNFSSSYFATKIKSVSVKFIGYNPVQLSPTPYGYLVPVGNDVLLSPITQGLEVAPSRQWRILDQFLAFPPTYVNIGATLTNNPGWIPIAEVSQQEPFMAIRRFAQMGVYYDGGLSGTPTELQNYKRLIGRSVWNTRWLLIILSGDLYGQVDPTHPPDTGVNRFINGINGDGEGVTDILLEFSTYSYPGN